MPLVTPYANKKLLIIDDRAEMRNSLRLIASDLGFERMAVVGTIREALDQMRGARFDVILCDYYLGDATDGQQFLEFLRSRSLISRAVLFIIVTAEKAYERVVTAAESMPDDYLLKPFTSGTLRARVDRLMEKKARLARVDKAQDARDWSEVIAGCDEILAARDKYFVDALRIKGNALVVTERFDDALALYNQVLAMRPTPWAKFGLARALKGKGDVVNSCATLEKLIEESPTFLAAYDFLGREMMEAGHGHDALAILNRAAEVSPRSLKRQRTMAVVAEDLGDFETVERVMTDVIAQTRYSPLREAGDYARLGTAHVEKGDPEKAIALINEAKVAFKERYDITVLAAAECIAHERAGDSEAAKQALGVVLQADLGRAPESVALLAAKACLVGGDADQGAAILRQLVQNNPDSAAAKERVVRVIETCGSGIDAHALVESSVKEVVGLNNRGVTLAQQGDYAGAAQLLTDAAERLPGNVQIVANAAYSLLLDIYANGFKSDKAKSAERFVKRLRVLAPQHAKLSQIEDVGRNIKQKYGVGVSS